MTRHRPKAISAAAALLALLLLAFASVQSTVMQSAMASVDAIAPICGDHNPGGSAVLVGLASTTPEQAAAGSDHNRHGTTHGADGPCVFCAAAAHAPALQQTGLIAYSSRCEFAAYAPVASHGPRGPPGVRHRARDPPFKSLTS